MIYFSVYHDEKTNHLSSFHHNQEPDAVRVFFFYFVLFCFNASQSRERESNIHGCVAATARRKRDLTMIAWPLQNQSLVDRVSPKRGA